MALTRKFLKALGIEDDKIEEIITAHGETVSGLKDEIEKAKQGSEDSSATARERDDLKQKVEALEKANGDAAKVQAEFDAYKARVDGEAAARTKTTLVRKALESANANPQAIDLLLKTINLDAVEIDGDKLKDEEAILTPVKTNYADFFGKPAEKGQESTTPPSSGKKEPEDLFEMGFDNG